MWTSSIIIRIGTFDLPLTLGRDYLFKRSLSSIEPNSMPLSPATFITDIFSPTSISSSFRDIASGLSRTRMHDPGFCLCYSKVPLCSVIFGYISLRVLGLEDTPILYPFRKVILKLCKSHRACFLLLPVSEYSRQVHRPHIRDPVKEPCQRFRVQILEIQSYGLAYSLIYAKIRDIEVFEG